MQLDLDSAWICGETAVGVRVHLAGDRITAVERIERPDNGWHALPGFVNAHCHLDLTSIHGETLAHATFAEWLAELLPRRGRLDEAAIDAAVDAGARALLATGTAAVGDIDSFGRSAARLRLTPLEGVAFREVVGRFDAGKFARLVADLEASNGPAADATSIGLSLSPHAPYSTGPESYAAAFAAAGARPVASHLAETEEEEELLLRGRGPLAELFQRLGFVPPVWGAGAESPAAAVFSVVPPNATLLVIHGNRLSRAELDACAQRRWPVVYCPRSHRYFGHPRHPAVELLKRGGILALGTDSRASNAGLDLWAEMACFRADDPAIDDAAILNAATAGGRRALHVEAAELAPGQPATFQLVRRRDGSVGRAGELVAAAVRAEYETHALFLRGRLVRAAAGPPLPE